MRKHAKTLLVINAEGVLEKPLVRDVRERGAQGWTVTEVHGASLEGVREGAWEADRTIEMKVICDAAVADTIAQHVLDTYAPHYSVALWFADVQVLRPERY
ncbi:MAG: transcriptional regulator [Burkholderiales bacterium]|jgi:nitrogen regulatory protein P-II 2|nr:transcriptional regulator [Burkholderiales bacterium]